MSPPNIFKNNHQMAEKSSIDRAAEPLFATIGLSVVVENSPVTRATSAAGEIQRDFDNGPREMSQNGVGSSLRDALGSILSKFEDLIFINFGVLDHNMCVHGISCYRGYISLI